MAGVKIRACVIGFLTGACIGLCIGVIGINTLVAYKLDQYLQQIGYLEAIVLDKDSRLRKLESAVNNKKYVLKNTAVVLNFTGDDFEKIQLEKTIKEKYHHLLGKDVNTIDIELVQNVIDHRILRLNDKEYKVEVTKVLLAETLTLWLNITPQK